jgi:hypothetical protein
MEPIFIDDRFDLGQFGHLVGCAFKEPDMSHVRTALSVTIAIVAPLALMLVGAVISFALFHGEGASQERRTVPPHPGREVAGDHAEIIHIALEVEKGATSKTMMIHGTNGKMLASFHAYRDGRFTLEPTEPNPLGFVFHRRESGMVDLSVGTGHKRFLIEARTDGSAQVLCKDQGGVTLSRMRVDAEGRVLLDSSPKQLDH